MTSAEALYQLSPEDFTAARDDAAKAAKAAGDAASAKELKALRKPSVGAWLVNRLVQEQPGLVEQLLDLGPALAAAQAKGAGDELRALGAQRRELVDAVVSTAVDLAGRPVSAAVRDEVASTLEAGLSDPGAAEAVRSGRLVRALSYAGFGGVDLEGAVARTTTRPPAAPKNRPVTADDRAQRVAAAEAAALEAAGRLDDAARACEAAERERAAADEHALTADAEVERLRTALEQAEAAARQARSERKHATEAAEKALHLVRTRQTAEEKARSELDRLRREKR